MERKLKAIERSIIVYKSTFEDGKPVKNKEVIIDISLDFLKEIVPPKEDDPLLYEGYMLNKLQVEKINLHLPEEINFNIDSEYCVLECTGIYE